MTETSYTSNGIAIGGSVGLILGLILGNGNIVWGITIGLGLGLVSDAIADTQRAHHKE